MSITPSITNDHHSGPGVMLISDARSDAHSKSDAHAKSDAHSNEHH